MSVLIDLIYGGSTAVAGMTEAALKDAIAKYGPEKEIAFPGTEYYFPFLYAATGVKVKTLEDLNGCVAGMKGMITNEENVDQALRAGLATVMGAEILEGLKYLGGPTPYETDTGLGFLPDTAVSTLGRNLISGEIPGAVAMIGRAGTASDVVRLVEDYREKGILIFLEGDVIEQCSQGGIEMGLDRGVIPLGHDITSLVHALTLTVRGALHIGKVKPGDLPGLLEFTRVLVPAVVNTFGDIDAVAVSAGAGAIALGFPVVVDIDLGENQLPGMLESVCRHSQTVESSLKLGRFPGFQEPETPPEPASAEETEQIPQTQTKK